MTLAMFANSIYNCLWRLLFLLVSVYDLCRWLSFRIIAFAQWSYDMCQTDAKRKQNERDFLWHCSKHLQKIPKHLNLIIGPEAQHINEEMLARIFKYALYMNIACVSYYDTRPDSNENGGGTSKRIPLGKVKCPELLKCKSLDDRHAIWLYADKDQLSNGKSHVNSKHKNHANGINHAANGVNHEASSNNCPKLSNGHLLSANAKNNNTIELYEIIPTDNRPLIAEVCRDLFRRHYTADIQNKFQTRSLLTSHLDLELKKHLNNISEPELCIVFHEHLCTFGLLPWHARFTEFHSHDPARRFDVYSFARILYKYSRCEQRRKKRIIHEHSNGSDMNIHSQSQSHHIHTSYS